VVLEAAAAAEVVVVVGDVALTQVAVEEEVEVVDEESEA